jgi:hypothetical protein
MKFGRFHGLVLLGLGAILVACQAFISVMVQGSSASSTAPAAPTASERPSIPPIFGIMGGPALVGGVVIFLVSPKKSLQEELNDTGKK